MLNLIRFVAKQVKPVVLVALSIVQIAPAAAQPVTLTATLLTGSWDLRAVCMNNRGTPGACIEMKRGSLQFTFASDGKWASVAHDTKSTNNTGTFEIEGSRLILKYSDGSLYGDWPAQADVDGKHLVTTTVEIISTFERIESAQS